MRILFILEFYHPHIGGVETLFKSLADHLAKQGHEITVFTNRHDSTLPKDEITSNSVRIVRRRFWNRYLFTFFAWWHALKFAKKADIIHTTSYNAAVPAWIVGKLTRTKCIITFHEYWGNLWEELPWMTGLGKWLHRLFERLLITLDFEKFAAVSDSTASALFNAGIKKEKISRIYNGIDYHGFPAHIGSQPNEPFCFLFFGRVGIAKGLDVLLEAYSELKKSHQRHKLKLILPSEQSATYRKVKYMIGSLDLHDVEIRHDLPFTELKKEISMADAVVIPSYSEGFCFAAVEAMAIGTPIVSSGRGALREVVNGRFIHSESLNPKDFAQAMSKAIEGKWTEEATKKYSLNDTLTQYLDLYESLLK